MHFLREKPMALLICTLAMFNLVEPVMPEYGEVNTYSISLIILIAAISSSLGTYA